MAHTKRRRTLAAIFAGGALALLPATGTVHAEDFYKGKTVSVIITSGVGGSVDLMNRLATRYLSKHIPGHPTVVAKNMDGAGGIVGANYIYNLAPKDGTQLGGSLNTVPFVPLFYGNSAKAKSLRFDPRKFEWIASPAPFIAVAIAWHTSPIKTWRDLLTTQMIVGSAGLASSSTVDAVFLKNVLGFKYKVLFGYPGGGDIDLAMIRGETQGRATTAWAGITSRHPDWLKKKLIRVLYQEGIEPNPGVPKDVPLLIDQIKDPEKKALLKLKMASYAMGYPVFAPPGVPADRVAILRKAFADTYRDPAYLADAKNARVLVAPISAEKLTKIIDDAYSAPADVKATLVQALQPGGGVLEKVKAVKVSSAISDIGKKGMLAFTAGGKPTHAKVGKKTKVTIDGKKAKGDDLKVGMNCNIEYYGDKSQAKAVACK